MTNKIFFLKEDEEYVQNIKNFFPNIEFEVIESYKENFDEKKIILQNSKEKKSPNQTCLDIAFEKSKILENKTEFFISFSSFICLGKRILENPKDKKEAYKQFSLISGRRNKIYSGFCLISKEKIHLKENSINVKMKHFDSYEIKKYIEEKDWNGKKPIYSLSCLEAQKLILFVNGSFQSGLEKVPIFELNNVLRQYFE